MSQPKEGQLAGICPECGQPLEVKRRRRDNAIFVGCSASPACSFTGPLTAAMEMRRAGALELPGLEGL